MLDKHTLSTIECAVSHECTKKCAFCEIGYKFIAFNPMSLKCGHSICSECDIEQFKGITGRIFCKFCQTSQPVVAKGFATEIIIQTNLDLIIAELREKSKKAINIYKGEINFC